MASGGSPTTTNAAVAAVKYANKDTQTLPQKEGVIYKVARFVKKAHEQSIIQQMKPESIWTNVSMEETEDVVIKFLVESARVDMLMMWNARSSEVADYVRSTAFASDVMTSLKKRMLARGGTHRISDVIVRAHTTSVLYSKFNKPVVYDEDNDEPPVKDMKQFMARAVR